MKYIATQDWKRTIHNVQYMNVYMYTCFCSSFWWSTFSAIASLRPDHLFMYFIYMHLFLWNLTLVLPYETRIPEFLQGESTHNKTKPKSCKSNVWCYRVNCQLVSVSRDAKRLSFIKTQLADTGKTARHVSYRRYRARFWKTPHIM